LNVIDHEIYIDYESQYKTYFSVIMTYFDALNGGVEESAGENVEMV